MKVADEGIALLNSIEGPVAPVVVIGPYRSGKSFLLNQLLGVPCSECPWLLQFWQLAAAMTGGSSRQHVCVIAAACSSNSNTQESNAANFCVSE